MQFNNPCPALSRPVRSWTPTRVRQNWTLYAKVNEPLRALDGTPDDHWQPDPTSPIRCKHVDHTPAWEAAWAEVERRQEAYETLKKF